MLDLLAFISLVPEIGGWIRGFKKKRVRLDERNRKAADALLRALNETEIYLGGVKRGQPQAPEREDTLSRAWTEAAACLHSIDADLAQRCRLKGKFWADPDGWTVEQLEKARIGINQVSEDMNGLLGWKETDDE
jgi:hypothetical protein